jgi:hypothetical protein
VCTNPNRSDVFHTTRSSAASAQGKAHHVRPRIGRFEPQPFVSSRRRVKPSPMDRMFFHTTRSTATEDQGNVHDVKPRIGRFEPPTLRVVASSCETIPDGSNVFSHHEVHGNRGPRQRAPRQTGIFGGSEPNRRVVASSCETIPDGPNVFSHHEVHGNRGPRQRAPRQAGILGARNPIVVSSRRRVKPFRMDRMFFHTTRSPATEDQGNVHDVRQGFGGLGTQSSCRRVVV